VTDLDEPPFAERLTGDAWRALAGRLALSWPRSHRYDGRCPECGSDCTREAVVRLAYTFEVCSCGQPEYAHLVERLHHRKCLAERTEP